MKVKLITAPTLEPVSVSEVKDHLRVDGYDSDVLIDGIRIAARQHVEDITRRALMTQTWECYLDDFPCEDYITLPFGNLVSVTSVKYKDDAGTETTMVVTTEYLVETNGPSFGRIVLPYAGSWPSGTLYPSNPITIRFVCGWASAALVPYPIKMAILMRCADLYEWRGESVAGQFNVIENKTIERLLWPHRLWGES